jgi:hypothetical protein
MMARLALMLAAALTAISVSVAAQRAGAFGAPRDHPAINYSNGPVNNVVADLLNRIEKGSVRLAFDADHGYLRSLLDALSIPVESQVLVYSETSFQAPKINKQNPRAVYFNDRVAVGWVRGGDLVEIAALDTRQGTVFYQLPQTSNAQIVRNDRCLACHLSWDTLAVPGPFVLSTVPRKNDGEYANGGVVNHGSPIAERWGGWFVTGAAVPANQLGNLDTIQPNMPASGPKPIKAPRNLEGQFDLRGYLTPYSDVVALMVLEHQAHATNLITRAGWEFRVASASRGGVSAARVAEAVEELVDYFLFVDEAPLPSPIRGSSGFAEKFAAAGVRDPKGRSLRDLQLDTRLFRYPCSYMIHSPAFEGLADELKAAVFARISAVLSGSDTRPRYAHLTAADRAAIAEILRATASVSVRHFL